MSASGFAQFIPLILIFVIFYFLLIRPQQKRVAEHKLMVSKLTRGDTVVTAGGIVGKISRIKLAKELSKRATGRTIYILDEPTTGLHVHDVKKLLEVLHTFVNKGNTVIVIEHNLDVIKTADWIIDMGPEGGVKVEKLLQKAHQKTFPL